MNIPSWLIRSTDPSEISLFFINLAMFAGLGAGVRIVEVKIHHPTPNNMVGTICQN
jgi:hypothetical protein